jgi:hypothetical protein
MPLGKNIQLALKTSSTIGRLATTRPLQTPTLRFFSEGTNTRPKSNSNSNSNSDNIHSLAYKLPTGPQSASIMLGLLSSFAGSIGLLSLKENTSMNLDNTEEELIKVITCPR